MEINYFSYSFICTGFFRDYFGITYYNWCYRKRGMNFLNLKFKSIIIEYFYL